MPNNRNIDDITEQPWLDTADWEIAFVPYEERPDAAHMLSINLTMLKNHISESNTVSEAIAELDRALDVLFMHSQFHDVSYLLFRRMAEGKLTFEQQTMLKTLGIKF